MKKYRKIETDLYGSRHCFIFSGRFTSRESASAGGIRRMRPLIAVVAYNLPGSRGVLKLTPDLLAGI
jgi:hypothetical protein